MGRLAPAGACGEGTMNDSLRKPVIYNLELTNGTTEYSQALPSGVRAFAMQPRTSVDVF